MFSKSKQSPNNGPTAPAIKSRAAISGSSTFSVIGSDVVITGNIKAEVDLHVDGRIEGDIICASLVQGQSSEIHGAITAKTARLAGTVKGSIDSQDLVIEASAHVTGDIAYDTLTIEQGGHVDGQFRHKTNVAAAAGDSANRAASAAPNASTAMHHPHAGSNGHAQKAPDAIPNFLKDGPAVPLKADLAS